MYLKIQKFYSAQGDSGGTVTLDVTKVQEALSKFDDLETKLNKITNAASKASSVKPSDLVNIEKATITSDSGVEIKPLSTSSGRPMISTYSYLVIDRVRKLCDNIIKADSLQLTTDDDNPPLVYTSDDTSPDKPKGSDSSKENGDKDKTYKVENVITPPNYNGNVDKNNSNSGDYTITDDVNDNGDGSSNNEGSVPDNGQYTIDGNINGIDSNGNNIQITPGNYDIVETKKDADGNITDICIIVNGEKVWISLKEKNVTSKEDNNVNSNDSSNDNNKNYTVGNIYNLDTNLTFTDSNGNKVTIKPGSYEIVDVKVDANGRVTAICIIVDNNYVWLVMNDGQVTNTLLQSQYDGMYVFDDVQLNIYDNNGNIVGTVSNGKYNVYEVIIDSNGNITWIRITKDGEPKYWINVYFNKTDWGTFITYEDAIKHNNSLLKMFSKNNGALIGVLGILIVGLGAVMYAKKGNKSKKIDEGTFAVYEINETEDGEISDVRVSPDDYAEEYWIKF